MNDLTVREIFSLNKTDGLVGVEIEVESNNGVYRGFPPTSPQITTPLSMWRAEVDNSLRGNSVEYVLRKPLDTGQAIEAVEHLRKAFKEQGTQVDDSFRAGVHIHLNFQEKTFQQLVLFSCLYYSLEEVLTEWCGSDRVGNHFCLRAIDAPGSVYEISKSIKSKSFMNFHNDEYRYAALNFTSLPKYGSLEFRAMSTKPDLKDVDKWIRVLSYLMEQSLKINDTYTVLEQFSMVDYDNWLRQHLPHIYDEIKDQKDLKMKGLRGIRLAQDFILEQI